ncbi:DNA-binding protein [Pantoea rodasii]|uniref:DNA-binding protein n=1 Tax=Pantoea rodasii TaxID=1076549 RepID=A0A2M9WHX0_9GAMM|nr:helix-turn-helix domain-containing protein [Pantoea rodasii]ORM62020.1 DNA-binding protein [Pantoea rodasii]PJZ07117.1 DNA-binding protein [Pantoea rodasii]
MNQKEDLVADWHPEDIKANLHKRGLSLAELGRRNGYAEGALKSVLRTPSKPQQRIVAEALGISPEIIWPSRYKTESYVRKVS